MRRLSILIHGFSGVGKTPLANTAPGPRLMIDSEGGYQWLRTPVVMWDPRTDPALLEINEDTTVVVRANDLEPINQCLSWLVKGAHPFRSVIIDSLTELQEKAKKSINTGPFEQRDWGLLLERLNNLILVFKELTENKVKPVDCVVLTAGSFISDKTGKVSPYVQGGLALKLPYKVAVLAHLARSDEDKPYMVIKPVGGIEGKDRTGYLQETYGPTIKAGESNKLDLSELLKVVNKGEIDG